MRTSRGYRFTKEFRHWPLTGREELNLTHVETHGRDLDEFIDNARISLETWHGNEGPAWELGDLPQKDYDALVAIFTEYLAEADRARRN